MCNDRNLEEVERRKTSSLDFFRYPFFSRLQRDFGRFSLWTSRDQSLLVPGALRECDYRIT